MNIAGAVDGVEAVGITRADHARQTLTAIWEDLLDTEVGPHDDFFELGGFSLLAVDVVGAARRSGLAMRAEDLFEHRTVASLAAALTAPAAPPPAPVLTASDVWRTAASPWDRDAVTCLVPLAPEGRGEPFFLVHVGTGNIRFAEPVVESWRAGRPFYGFEAPGYRGDVRPLISLTAMADRYLLELRELQPHGPYFLGGLCQGGLVAYEMARRLRASGEEVRALVLVNPPSQVSLVDPGWGLDELLSFRLASLSAQFGLPEPLDPAETLARIRPLHWYDDAVAPEEFARLQVLWSAGMFAQEHFEILPYDGPVTAFARKEAREQLALYWPRAAPGFEVSWYDARATHPIMVDPEVGRRVRELLTP
ncbi:thioesterase domain-containing protein [Streptomyces acidiscabies]|uniref:thioesterase domain-containing protein n=1 Tax=Streptomyces acidiscabies TaxID=42234 RepID=UPI00073E4D32|nr:thioesterase domain-containing protein [Streptomyces acidiscabies]GAQ50581.1 polyketide synthase PksR [Streptomyces acidiscabies]GAV37484.1 polyketide synthase PksR [Streptomyces acidiscabies]